MNISSKQSSKTKGNFLLLSSFFKLNNKKFRGGIFYVVFIYLDYNVSSSSLLTINCEFDQDHGPRPGPKLSLNILDCHGLSLNIIDYPGTGQTNCHLLPNYIQVNSSLSPNEFVK